MRTTLRVNHDTRHVIADLGARHFGVVLDAPALLTGPGAIVHSTRFVGWPTEFDTIEEFPS